MRLHAFLRLSAAAAMTLSAAAVHARGLSPSDLVMLDRASDIQPSPDGRHIVFDVRSTDMAADKGVHTPWIVDVGAPGSAHPLEGAKGDSSARWAPDGRSLFVLRDGQVWRICAQPGCAAAPRQITQLPLDIEAFRVSPDGRRLVVSMAVFPDAESPMATKARLTARSLPSAGTGRVYDRLFVRHWDTWADGTRNHLFALALNPDGSPSGDAVPLTPGLDGDVPGKPFGDDADFSFSPDSRTIFFSMRVAGASPGARISTSTPCPPTARLHPRT